MSGWVPMCGWVYWPSVPATGEAASRTKMTAEASEASRAWCTGGAPSMLLPTSHSVTSSCGSVDAPLPDLFDLLGFTLRWCSSKPRVGTCA